MLKFVDKQPSLIFNRKRLFHATNRINDQIVVLGADVDAIEPVCKIARAKGLDAFGITEFDITMAINVSKFHLFYNLRS